VNPPKRAHNSEFALKKQTNNPQKGPLYKALQGYPVLLS
jgi:hypothetical protein